MPYRKGSIMAGRRRRRDLMIPGPENEDLKNQSRQLKLQINNIYDENTRLRTKMQQMENDLIKKERDIEALTFKLSQSSRQGTVGSNVFEVRTI